MLYCLEGSGLDRDSELIKVQVLADYCQARFNFFGSIFVGAIVGLLVVVIATSYTRQVDVAAATVFVIAVRAVGYVGLKYIMKAYHDDLDLIETLLSQVENAQSLPTLTELRKMR